MKDLSLVGLALPLLLGVSHAQGVVPVKSKPKASSSASSQAKAKQKKAQRKPKQVAKKPKKTAPWRVSYRGARKGKKRTVFNEAVLVKMTTELGKIATVKSVSAILTLLLSISRLVL